MKQTHGLVLAATLVVASFAVTGCSNSSDEGAEPEQASVQAVAANEGITQDACPNAPRARGVGFRRGERVGFRLGERAGFPRAQGFWRGAPVRRAWWRFW